MKRLWQKRVEVVNVDRIVRAYVPFWWPMKFAKRRLLEAARDNLV